VTQTGIQATERTSGKGISFSTPTPPVVQGRTATFPGQLGLTWSYVTRDSGIKLSAPVQLRLHAKTLSFTYSLLGGAAPLAIAGGNLESDVFTLPAPVAYGADGYEYPLGTWRLGPGDSQISADIDDSALPAVAFPYQLDPTTIFIVGASGDDGYFLQSDDDYPPTATIGAFPSGINIGVSRDYVTGVSNPYRIRVGLARWNTAAIPDNATIIGASLNGYVTSVTNDNARSLTADWYSWTPPISAGHYTANAQTSASFAQSGWDLSAFTIGQNNTLSLSQPDLYMSKTGYTGLRFHISGSTPSGVNSFNIASWDSTNPKPTLVVTWDHLPSVPSNVAPANASSVHSVTPTLEATATDADSGDTLEYYFRVCTNQAMTSCVWSGWSDWFASGAVASVTVPASTLGFNTTYYWQAAEVYDGQLIQIQGGPVWSFTTTNVAPSVPASAAPSAGGFVSSLLPTLMASASDTDGDEIAYSFHVATQPDGSGTAIDSGWIEDAEWTPPVGSLADGRTYYWQIRARDALEDAASSYSAWSPLISFKTGLLGALAGRPTDSLGPVSVNLANGNLMISVSSPQVNAVGGFLGLSYAYNCARPSNQGLSGAYHNDLDADAVFDAAEEPAVVRTDPQVSFNWKTGSPYGLISADHFLARWTGYLNVPTDSRATGTYKFGTRADDGTKVWIDNALVFDHWVNQGAPASAQYGSASTLDAGDVVPIKIESYENTGVASVELWMNGPCGANFAVSNCIVPSSWLTTDAPGLPDGWMLSADSDGMLGYTGAQIGDDQAVLTDASGAAHTYTWTGSGWAPPEDEEAVLANDAASGLLVLHGEDGNVYSFNADGSLASVVAALDDRTPAAPAYTWAPLPGSSSILRLTQITDPVSNRSVTLRYGADGGCPSASGYDAAPSAMLCKVDFSAFGLGVSELYYSNKHLARILDPGAATTDFGYDTSGALTQIRDVLTNDLIAAGAFADPTSTTHMSLIGYNTERKVESITSALPGAGLARPQHTYSYAPPVTKVHVTGITEANGYYRQVTTDAAGRTPEDRDFAAKLTTSEWDAGDRLIKTVDPTGIVTTTIYDTLGRPTDTYGPGAGTEFSGYTSSSAPHASTIYDEGITGLAATWWNNPNLAAAPKLHTTLASWPAASPGSPIPANGFSGRYTGEITASAAGEYSFSASTDAANGAKLFIDDEQVFARWAGTGTASGVATLSQGLHRVRLDFQNPATPVVPAGITLSWTPPGAASVQIPMSVLGPAYGLVTTTQDAALKKTKTEYANPELGLVTASVIDPDAGGLALRSTTTFETPGTGYLRRTARTLPKGAATTVSYSYYGGTETATNPCTSATGVVQAGLLKTATSADPDGTGPKLAIRREFVSDAAGRTVATRVNSGAGHVDAFWTCVTYDSRGRVATKTDSQKQDDELHLLGSGPGHGRLPRFGGDEQNDGVEDRLDRTSDELHRRARDRDAGRLRPR
jgi:YD repeat-containing protein